MLKAVGVLAIAAALAIGVAIVNGSLDVDVNLTDQGKQELIQARNEAADVIRAGAGAAAEKAAEAAEKVESKE